MNTLQSDDKGRAVCRFARLPDKMTSVLVQKNGAVAIGQLELLPAQDDAYVYRMHNFGGRCKMSPYTGTK